MQEVSVGQAMIVMAVATVVLGLLVLAIGNFSAAQAGEAMPPGMRRNAILLIVAGPLGLVSWLLFNGLLAQVGYRSLIGYGLATLVFVGGGFLTGLFARLRSRRGRSPYPPQAEDANPGTKTE